MNEVNEFVNELGKIRFLLRKMKFSLWTCTYLLVDDFICKSKLIRLSCKNEF